MDQPNIGRKPARSTPGVAGDPEHGSVVLRWARHWPYVTAPLIGLTVWFATSLILAKRVPAASPAIGWSGLLVGVAIGTPLAGLKGSSGWVVVPVIVLALAAIVGGILAVCGARIP